MRVFGWAITWIRLLNGLSLCFSAYTCNSFKPTAPPSFGQGMMVGLLELPQFACLPSVAKHRICFAKNGFPFLPTTKALCPKAYLTLGHAKIPLVPPVFGLGPCNPCSFLLKAVVPIAYRCLPLPGASPWHTLHIRRCGVKGLTFPPGL